MKPIPPTPRCETKSDGQSCTAESSHAGRKLAWDTPDAARVPGVTLEPIPRFDARGMRRIYGRGDHFPPAPSPVEGFGPTRTPTFCMDIWQARSGRIFVRFWSRGCYVDWCSYELCGMVIPVGALRPAACANEGLVPTILRDRYEAWVGDCLEYPDD